MSDQVRMPLYSEHGLIADLRAETRVPDYFARHADASGCARGRGPSPRRARCLRCPAQHAGLVSHAHHDIESVEITSAERAVCSRVIVMLQRRDQSDITGVAGPRGRDEQATYRHHAEFARTDCANDVDNGLVTMTSLKPAPSKTPRGLN